MAPATVFRGVTIRLVGAIALAALVCTILGSFLLGYRNYRQHLADLKDALRRTCAAHQSEILTNVSASSRNPAAASRNLTRTYVRVHNITRDLRHFSVIKLAHPPVVLFAKGAPLGLALEAEVSFLPPLSERTRRVAVPGGALLVHYRLVRDPRTGNGVAIARIGAGVQTGLQFLQGRLRRDLLSVFLPLVLFGIATAFLVAFFTRPFRSVASYAQAIERGQLHERINVSGKDEARTIAEALNIVLHRLKQSYVSTLAALATLLESKDPSTESHSMRGVGYALELGKAVGLSEQELMDLEYGAYLHDIGKVGVDDNILKKTGALTEEDWHVMRQHPAIGYAVLKNLEFLQNALPVVLYHQERYDGNGYPHGVKGDEIPLLARIFTIADAFDAMTTNRPYRRAMKAEHAIEEIRANSGGQFDPRLAQVFITLWEKGRLDDVKGQPGFDVLSEFRTG